MWGIREVRWLRLVAAVSVGLLGAAQAPGVAHEAKCPVCKLDVPQDTAQADNEVILRYGRKRIEYRCAYCAVLDSKSFEGDLSVLVPSEKKAAPMLIARKAGKWSITPESAVFAASKPDHAQCPVIYRGYSSVEAYQRAARDTGGAGQKPAPITLQQLVELAR
jgi:hypothetical protein